MRNQSKIKDREEIPCPILYYIYYLKHTLKHIIKNVLFHTTFYQVHYQELRVITVTV